MATDPQTLLSSAQCYNCYGPGGWPIIEKHLLSFWSHAVNPSCPTESAQTFANVAGYNNASAQAWLLKLGLERNILLGLSPATPTDPQSLLAIASCYNCYGPGAWPLIYLELLNQIVLGLNPTAATDPASIMANAQCTNNYSAQSWLVKLAILQCISQGVNPSAKTDYQSLLASANCFNCYGPGIWPLLELAMLSVIAGGAVVAAPAILMENSGYVLTETGGHILLEH